MYYVYALYNIARDKLYIGQTNNLKRRLLEHNADIRHYTGKGVGSWELAYSENFKDRSTAIAREKELKSHRGRDFVRKQMNNPE